jgi:hypothetical protein
MSKVLKNRIIEVVCCEGPADDNICNLCHQCAKTFIILLMSLFVEHDV